MNLIIAKLNALCNLTVNGKAKIIKSDGNVVIDIEDQQPEDNAAYKMRWYRYCKEGVEYKVKLYGSQLYTLDGTPAGEP